MGMLDVILTTAQAQTPVNSNTTGKNENEIVPVSEFLTVQSLANFTAITAAITVAWKALVQLYSGFGSNWTPFVLALAWLAVSLILSIQSGNQKQQGGKWWWIPLLFVGFLNSMVVFAAAIGIS